MGKEKGKMAKKKLFEFAALLKCAVVVAAESEEDAREAIKTWDWASFESVKCYARANIAKKRAVLERKVVPLKKKAEEK